VGHVGGIGGFDELTLQSGQGLLVFADQERIRHIQYVPPLRFRKLDA
jgi:hypothetical protein